MHACGHDVHLAAAVALGRAAAAVTPRGPRCRPRCCSCCNPARSCPVRRAGRRGLRRCWATTTSGRCIGVHLQPRVAAGQLAVDPGVVNAAVDEFTITVTGRGGHSAYPHLARDPVPALCQAVLAVRDAATVIDPMSPSVVTVGMLEAAGAPNVIGEVARARGTVRTFERDDRDLLHQRMRAATSGTAAAFGCTGELSIALGETALRNDPELVSAVRDRLQTGAGTPGPPDLKLGPEFRSCGSDDFAAYSEVLPSLMMFLGVTDGSPMLHDARFLPPDDLVGQAAGALLAGYLGAVDLIDP